MTAVFADAFYFVARLNRRDQHHERVVDLCIVAEGAAAQLKAAQAFRRAMRPIRPKPAFALVPIAPERLAEKKALNDFFFATVLREGVLLASED